MQNKSADPSWRVEMNQAFIFKCKFCGNTNNDNLTCDECGNDKFWLTHPITGKPNGENVK